jgi:hypothetical protein
MRLRRAVAVLAFSFILLVPNAFAQVQPPVGGGSGNGCSICDVNWNQHTVSCYLEDNPRFGQHTYSGCNSGWRLECMPTGDGTLTCVETPDCGEECLWA